MHEDEAMVTGLVDMDNDGVPAARVIKVKRRKAVAPNPLAMRPKTTSAGGEGGAGVAKKIRRKRHPRTAVDS
jgi:hypothetical protein